MTVNCEAMVMWSRRKSFVWEKFSIKEHMCRLVWKCKYSRVEQWLEAWLCNVCACSINTFMFDGVVWGSWRDALAGNKEWLVRHLLFTDNVVESARQLQCLVTKLKSVCGWKKQGCTWKKKQHNGGKNMGICYQDWQGGYLPGGKTSGIYRGKKGKKVLSFSPLFPP